MKLFFVSSYHYPAYPAQFKHGLIMAQNYSKILKENALYSVLYAKEKKYLEGLNCIEINRLFLPLRNLRLISLFYFFWLGWFFWKSKKWRGRQVVTITQESKIAFLLLFWKRIFNFFVIYECHGLHSSLTDKFVSCRADYVIFVTKGTQDVAEARFGKIKKSVLLPNAVDFSSFDSAKQRKIQLRKELGLPEGKIIAGYVGRFTALGFDKGIGNSLVALKEIKNENLLMCFVGGTKDEITHFKKMANELGLSDRVIFVPYQTEMTKVADYMVAMDILIYLPPPEKFFIEETSPMKIFEYMAAEKPILVSDFPSFKEILDVKSAVFVDPLDSKEITKAIKEMITDSVFSQKLAQNAYQKVRNNTWEKRAISIINLSEKLTLAK